MNFFILIPQYLSWHYSKSVGDLLNNYKNFLVFIWEFFSISFLIKTLFTPFQRLKEKYKGGLDLEDLFAVIVTNVLMRIVGFIVRSLIIIIGLVCLSIFVVFGVVLLILWVLLPVVIIAMFIFAITNFFKIS
jgi:hypothetical protein